MCSECLSGRLLGSDETTADGYYSCVIEFISTDGVASRAACVRALDRPLFIIVSLRVKRSVMSVPRAARRRSAVSWVSWVSGRRRSIPHD
ncbi:hypothetical protein KGM_210543 [Danaus plexippus plexippus]|uniref:Uncharacterized protein n=1 Tax=Danaus plexippus plexippus TaxID=278856 RepID=A0A212EHG9_DANPL|nr:hypothetical protein KGM_210543 [Danaus plexippus plexippus]